MRRLDIRASLILAAALVAQPAHGLALRQASTAPRPPRVAENPPAQGATTTAPPPSPAQAVEPVSHSTQLSSREASAVIELSNGNTVSLTLRDGGVLLNGERLFAYSRGGRLDRQVRALLDRAGSLTAEELVFGIRSLSLSHAPASAQEAWTRVLEALPPVSVTALPEAPEPPEPPALPDIGVAVEGMVAQAVRGVQQQRGFGPERLATDAAGLLGALIALSALGFGAVFFVPQRLETVADTVARSPGRSFLTGLCAQPLILPALATLIIALVLTIVGVLVVPVAIILFALALAAGLVGGYLSVARVVGEIYVKRRGLEGRYTGGWTTYRYLVYGLIGLMAIWVPAALLSWVPVAGMILLMAALVFSWIMVSAGLGAVILSRGGTRATFGSGSAPMLSTGSYWTAPQQATGSASEMRHS